MATNTVTFDRAAMEQLDQMFGKHTKELQTLARNMAQQVNGRGSMGMPGLRNGGDKNEDMRKELESFLAVMRNNNKTLTATEKYNRNAAKRELDAVNARIKAEKDLTDVVEDQEEAIVNNKKAQEEQSDKIKRASGRLADFAEKVVGGTMSFTVLSRAINEFSQAYKQGFNWNAMSDTINAALQMGMSPKDMMDFQKRFRTVSNTFEGGISQFNDVIGASTNEWKFYTGSLKDAAVAQGEFYQLALSMGVGAKDMKGAVGGMFQEFKKLQVATSMTAEEFVATQKSLMAEQVVRSKLVGLQGKERSNYMLKLTDTAYMFQTLGLQKEAAESLVKALEQQSGKNGVTRLTEGAQMNMLTGMLGMGGDGNRLRELTMKKNRTTDENQEFASLSAKLSKLVQTEVNAGGYREMRMDALKTQMPGLFETLSSVGDQAALASGAGANPAAIEKQRLDIAERDSGVYGVIKDKITLVADILSGWSQSALAALVAFGVGKGALAGGRMYLARKQAAAAGGGPPIPPPGGGPVPPVPANAYMTAATKMLKTGGAALVLGIAASAAVGAVVKDEKTKNVADSAITGAGIGATIGSVIPVIGTLGGAAIGGLVGGMIGVINNQETMEDNLNKQKKQIVEQASLDQRRFEQAQKAYQTEIDQLTQKGKLNDEEQKRVDALKAAMEQSKTDHSATQAKLGAAQTGYQLGKQADTQDWMSQAANGIKNGKWWGGSTSNEDTNAVLSQMAGKLNAAGLNLSEAEIRQQVGNILGSMATKEGLGSDKQKALFDAQASISEGTGNFDTSVNPMIAQAMQQYQSQVSAGFSKTNQASFDTKFSTPEAIAGLAEQVKTTADQLAKDKSALAATQAFPDEFGSNLSAAADIQKRIDNSQATLDALQQLASKDNTVKFQSEDKLLEVLTKIADGIKSGNAPPVVHQ